VTGVGDGKGPGVSPRIEYPLLYAFKVMGLAADDFEAHARALVASAAGTEAGRMIASDQQRCARPPCQSVRPRRPCIPREAELVDRGVGTLGGDPFERGTHIRLYRCVCLRTALVRSGARGQPSEITKP